MALSISDGNFNASWKTTIIASQDAGLPIPRLMLPQAVILNGENAVMELREIIEVEDFHVDWPDPFQREGCIQSIYSLVILIPSHSPKASALKWQ